MNHILLDVWEASPLSTELTLIIPDGCRDLILKQPKNEAPYWFISPLFPKAKPVLTEPETIMKGFRLQPGANINEHHLIASLNNHYADNGDVIDKLDHFAYRNDSIIESIECFSSGMTTVNEAAKRLGVSQRTLQRFTLKETGKAPSYWLKLARVRKAVRDLYTSSSAAEIAYRYGYSDQAHMCRDIKNWFTLSASEIKQCDDVLHQISDTAYC